jgi:hypothetical protein
MQDRIVPSRAAGDVVTAAWYVVHHRTERVPSSRWLDQCDRRIERTHDGLRDLIDGLIASIAENSFDPFDFSLAFRGEIKAIVKSSTSPAWITPTARD